SCIRDRYFSLKKNNHFKMFFVLTCVFFVICAVVIPVSYETRIVVSDECIVEHKPFTDDVFYDYGDADEVYVYVNEEWVRKSSWAKRLCVEVTFDKDVIQFRQKYFGRSMINQEKFISLFDESAVVKNPENKEKIKFKSEDNKKALDRIFAE
ncbi:MAG: hypothetical protein K2F67_04880, partial [Eubacterium sp.]|nr:hypothetical protein [Eubacterium sp.]